MSFVLGLVTRDSPMPKARFVLVCCRHFACVTSCNIHASRRPCGRLFVLVFNTKDTALLFKLECRHKMIINMDPTMVLGMFVSEEARRGWPSRPSR